MKNYMSPKITGSSMNDFEVINACSGGERTCWKGYSKYCLRRYPWLCRNCCYRCKCSYHRY